jgi:hypothetical protein
MAFEPSLHQIFLNKLTCAHSEFGMPFSNFFTISNAFSSSSFLGIQKDKTN